MNIVFFTEWAKLVHIEGSTYSNTDETLSPLIQLNIGSLNQTWMFKLMFFFFTKYSDLVPIMGSIYDNNDKNFTSLIPLDTACLRIYLTVFTPSSLFIE